MSNCSLKRKFATQNARNYLLVKGGIDQQNNIIDEKVVHKAMDTFKNHAQKEYGFDADFLSIRNNKVSYNKDAFLAVDIIKGDVERMMGNTPKVRSYLNQAETLFEPGVSATYDPYFDQATSTENTPSLGLTNLVSLKEGLLKRAEDRLSKIKVDLKTQKDNLPEYTRLLKLQARLKEYLDGSEVKEITGLRMELEALKQIDTRSPELIEPYIRKELDRLAQLVRSQDYAEIKEAREIISFIKALGEFNYNTIAQSATGHPLYHIRELFDEDKNFIFTDGMKAPYMAWAAEARSYEDRLAATDARILETEFNNNPRIKELYGGHKFTYEQIVSSKEGLKELNLVDMMIMDISSGIFSNNGLMPQVIRNTVDNAFERQQAWARKIQQKIDDLNPGVVEELKKMGYSLKGLGILGVNGASYDLFKQTIPGTNGQSTGNLAHKFSYKWFEDKSEVEDAFFRKVDEAMHTPDPAARGMIFKQAIDKRNNWYKANTLIVDPSKLSAIASDSLFDEIKDEFSQDAAAIAAHEAEIKALVGEAYFNKVIEAQKEKLATYMAQKQSVLDEALALENVRSTGELSEKGKRGLAVWEAEHSPFKGVEYRNAPQGGFTVGQGIYHSKFDFNESLPLAKDYYDGNYAKIEANPVLSEFYDVMAEALSGMMERFPHDVQQKLSATSIAYMKKDIMEILTDKDLDFLKALSQVFRRILDNIRSIFGINPENEFSYAKVNTVTGLPDYKVNDSFISQNADKIRDLFQVNTSNFKALINKSLPGEGLKRLSRFTTLNIALLSDEAIAVLSSNYLGKPMDRASLRAQFEGDIIPVGKIIHRNAQHQIAQEKSFDLPKVIKHYSDVAAQYTARQEVLPLIEMMKDHYQQIKKQVTNNVGEAVQNVTFDKNGDPNDPTNRVNGLRVNANKQMDEWFERVALGNTGTMKHWGVRKGEEKDRDLEDILADPKADKGIQGKILTKKEKQTLREVNRALATETDEDAVKRLLKIRGGLGRTVAASAVVDSFLSFVRFKALGFNLSSGITNFIEGQLSNSIAAASGVYFQPEHIYELSPSEMIAGNLIKQTNPGWVPEKVARAAYFAKAADVFQDNTNDLQKASAKTTFGGMKRFNPFYVMTKTEEFNQTPLMVATMKSEPITAIDETVGNVWDALEAVYYPETKSWKTQLKPEYRTEENIASWENLNGEAYLNWKAKIRQVIANSHGDFSNTGGMLAKSYQGGKALMMFKTWLPRELHKRLAMEQDDILSGVKGFKGRYRSHTPTTAAMQGAIAGTFFLGPGIGTAVGTGIGIGLSKFFGAKSQMNILQELWLSTFMLVKKLFGMPVNLIGSAVGKNKIINTNLSDSKFEQMQSATFTKQDFNNLRANLQEMSIQLAFIGLLLLTKAFLWDDDDEEDSNRRMAHNLLANRFMSLAGQSMGYFNLFEMNKNLNMPMIKFGNDMMTAIADFNRAFTGEDTLLAGENAGRSKALGKAVKVFIPGTLADPASMGFGKQAARQFQVSEFDHLFWGEEKISKRTIQAMKARRKVELEDEGMTDEQVEKILKKEFPPKKKKQTYSERLKRLEEDIEKREEAED